MERLICGLCGDKKVHFCLKMFICTGTSQWFSQDKEQLLSPGHCLFQTQNLGVEILNISIQTPLRASQILFLPRNEDLCRESLPGPDIFSILARCSLLRIHSSRAWSGAGARKTQRVQSVNQPRGQKNPTQPHHFTLQL